MAEDNKQPISAPEGGQIALTAHNNGDGTWSVTRGPGGAVLRDGLPREKALAIVGGSTGPYEPENDQEAEAADERRAVEAEAAAIEEKEAFKPDEAKPAPKKGASSNVKAVGNAGEGGAKAKNGGE